MLRGVTLVHRAEAVAQRIAAVGGAGSALGWVVRRGSVRFRGVAGVSAVVRPPGWRGGGGGPWCRLWAIMSNRNSVRTFILPRR